MQVERRELAYQVVWCSPDLHMGIMRDSNVSMSSQAHGWSDATVYVLSIWREFDGLHRLVKVEVMQHHSSPEVDQQRTSICQ